MWLSRWNRTIGPSLSMMRLCHALEAIRRLSTSVSGNDEMIWICNSFGSARNSWSKGMLDGKLVQVF
jgi:hypothetical protein